MLLTFRGFPMRISILFYHQLMYHINLKCIIYVYIFMYLYFYIYIYIFDLFDLFDLYIWPVLLRVTSVACVDLRWPALTCVDLCWPVLTCDLCWPAFCTNRCIKQFYFLTFTFLYAKGCLAWQHFALYPTISRKAVA